MNGQSLVLLGPYMNVWGLVSSFGLASVRVYTLINTLLQINFVCVAVCARVHVRVDKHACSSRPRVCCWLSVSVPVCTKPLMALSECFLFSLCLISTSCFILGLIQTQLWLSTEMVGVEVGDGGCQVGLWTNFEKQLPYLTKKSVFQWKRSSYLVIKKQSPLLSGQHNIFSKNFQRNLFDASPYALNISIA